MVCLRGICVVRRALKSTVNQMNTEGFGVCSNIGPRAAECPAGITLENIAILNREYLMAKVTFNKRA